MSKEIDPFRSLFTIERFQDYEGEERANLLRVIGVGAFYLIHYLHFHKVKLGALQLDDVEISQRFHIIVSAFCAAWALMALSVLVCLRGFTLPSWVKFATTAGDLMLLTAILCIGDGPRSPIVVGYFLILCIAALRFNLKLIQVATVGALGGYLVVLGCARWPEWIGRDPMGSVSRYEQLVMLIAIGLTGIILGQVIRRTRRLVMSLANQSGRDDEATATQTSEAGDGA